MIKRITPEQEPILCLARLLLTQRRKRVQPQTLTSYCQALQQRMCEIRENAHRAITGRDLFCSIPRLKKLSWEDVSGDEQRLYDTTVEAFNNEAEAEQQPFKEGETAPHQEPADHPEAEAPLRNYLLKYKLRGARVSTVPLVQFKEREALQQFKTMQTSLLLDEKAIYVQLLVQGHSVPHRESLF